MSRKLALTKEDLLGLLKLRNAIIGNRNRVSLHMERAGKPAIEKLAVILTREVRDLGTYNWVYGNIDESSDLLREVSKHLKAKLYFPQEGLCIPASHQRSEQIKIVFVRTSIGDADIAEIVNFRKGEGKEVTSAAVVTLFDFREKLLNPEISVRSVYKGKDLPF